MHKLLTLLALVVSMTAIPSFSMAASDTADQSVIPTDITLNIRQQDFTVKMVSLVQFVTLNFGTCFYTTEEVNASKDPATLKTWSSPFCKGARAEYNVLN